MRTLLDADIAAIQQLAHLCEEHDHVDLRINLDALHWRSGDKANDLLYYRDDQLIGFLTLDGLGFDEAEAAGMVHPDQRRRGVFRALVDAACDECRQQGTETLILIADHRSQAAPACAQAIGAAYDFSEHNMRLAQTMRLPSVEHRLTFRKAGVADSAAIASVLTDEFQTESTQLQQNIEQNMASSSYQYYLALLGQDPAGTLNVQTIDGDAYIYGFVVVPELRGRGYGKEILVRTVEDITAARPQPVFLDVETNNTPALALYRSLGFEVTVTYDYYRLPIAGE